MSLIRAKYSGRCRNCGQSVKVGDSVYWERGNRGVTCANCGNGNSEVRSAEKTEKLDVKSVKLPGSSKREKERFFTIDWADFKEILKDAVFNRSSKLSNRTNANYVIEHTKGNQWSGFSQGQLKRWLTEGFQTDAIKGLGEFIPPIREKRRLQFLEEGDEFHIDLAWNGADNYFSEWTKREVIPGVAIEAGIMFAGLVDAATVNAYNTWLCKAAYSLEASGIDCQVTLDFPSWNLFQRGSRRISAGTGELVHNIVRVKKENETSDFLSWSAMMSPAALRGFGFALGAIHADSAGETISSSFGRGVPERSEWKVVYDEDRRVIVVENAYMGYGRFPEEDMTRQLREILKQLNG